MVLVEHPGTRMEARQEFLKAGRRFIVSGVFELRMTCRKIAKKARQSLGMAPTRPADILTMHRERRGCGLWL